MQPEITVYGADWCEDTQRTRKHLNDLDLDYTYVNVDQDGEANAKVMQWNNGRRITPTVVISSRGRTGFLSAPENHELDMMLEEADIGRAA